MITLDAIEYIVVSNRTKILVVGSPLLEKRIIDSTWKLHFDVRLFTLSIIAHVNPHTLKKGPVQNGTRFDISKQDKADWRFV